MQPWNRIAHALAVLKAVRYRSEARTIVQRTKIASELANMLKMLGISMPKLVLDIADPDRASAAA